MKESEPQEVMLTKGDVKDFLVRQILEMTRLVARVAEG